MTSIFSDSPAAGKLHLLPEKTTAISYNFTSDQLMLAAHMEDNSAEVDQRENTSSVAVNNFFSDHCRYCNFVDGRRCQSVLDVGFNADTNCPRGLTLPEPRHFKFDVAPTIFHIYLGLSNRHRRFERVGYDKAVLQGSKVTNKRIKLSRNKKALANTYSDSNRICWGNNLAPKNLKSMARVFFEAPFNNDLVKIRDFEHNNQLVKEDIEQDNFFRTYSTRYNFIAEKADALFMVHAEDNVSAFFWMIAAGFKSIKEAPFIILLPLKRTEFEHEGVTYCGYLTSADACGKEWFINRNGELLGQM
jgi:hypothetical protein